jgi:phospholipid-binding lipoprotein MlaA
VTDIHVSQHNSYRKLFFSCPSNLRDTAGMIPDYFLTPQNYIEDSEARAVLTGVRLVNDTSLRIGEYESLKNDAVDLYPFIRDAYEQHRERMIKE